MGNWRWCGQAPGGHRADKPFHHWGPRIIFSDQIYLAPWYWFWYLLIMMVTVTMTTMIDADHHAGWPEHNRITILKRRSQIWSRSWSIKKEITDIIIDHYKEEIIYMINFTCQVLANSGFRLSLPIGMPGDGGSMVFASLSSILILPPFYETVITTVSTTSKKIAIDFTRCISSSTIQRWPGMRWGRIQEESIFVLSLLHSRAIGIAYLRWGCPHWLVQGWERREGSPHTRYILSPSTWVLYVTMHHYWSSSGNHS